MKFVKVSLDVVDDAGLSIYYSGKRGMSMSQEYLNEVEEDIVAKLMELDDDSVKRVLNRLNTENAFAGCAQWACNLARHGEIAG